MTLISRADYPAVRASINIELDEIGLPDSIIALNIYQGRGEADVLIRDPIAATRTDPIQKLQVMTAAILFTASYIVLALPQLIQETYGTHYNVKRQEIKREDLAAALRSAAHDQLDFLLLAGVEEPDRPAMFVLGDRAPAQMRPFGPGVYPVSESTVDPWPGW